MNQQLKVTDMYHHHYRHHRTAAVVLSDLLAQYIFDSLTFLRQVFNLRQKCVFLKKLYMFDRL